MEPLAACGRCPWLHSTRASLLGGADQWPGGLSSNGLVQAQLISELPTYHSSTKRSPTCCSRKLRSISSFRTTQLSSSFRAPFLLRRYSIPAALGLAVYHSPSLLPESTCYILERQSSLLRPSELAPPILLPPSCSLCQSVPCHPNSQSQRVVERPSHANTSYSSVIFRPRRPRTAPYHPNTKRSRLCLFPNIPPLIQSSFPADADRHNPSPTTARLQALIAPAFLTGSWPGGDFNRQRGGLDQGIIPQYGVGTESQSLGGLSWEPSQ